MCETKVKIMAIVIVIILATLLAWGLKSGIEWDHNIKEEIECDNYGKVGHNTQLMEYRQGLLNLHDCYIQKDNGKWIWIRHYRGID